MLASTCTRMSSVAYSQASVWRRTYATAIKFSPKPLADGGVLYTHVPTTMPEADVATLRSTATGLSEEQKKLIRQMRLEDPLKNNATYLAKYFGVKRTTILKVAPLSESVRLQVFGVPTIPSGEGKKKPDIAKWKAMVQRKEHENWASRKETNKEYKKFNKSMAVEAKLQLHAASKAIERAELTRQYSKEKMLADDQELVKRGLLKGGVLKANQFIRADNKGKKK